MAITSWFKKLIGRIMVLAHRPIPHLFLGVFTVAFAATLGIGVAMLLGSKLFALARFLQQIAQ